MDKKKILVEKLIDAVMKRDNAKANQCLQAYIANHLSAKIKKAYENEDLI